MSIGIERIEFWKEESNKNYLITKEHIELQQQLINLQRKRIHQLENKIK